VDRLKRVRWRFRSIRCVGETKKTECRPATSLVLLRDPPTIETIADNVATLVFVAFTRVVLCTPCGVAIRYGKDAQRARSGDIFPARPWRRERERENRRARSYNERVINCVFMYSRGIVSAAALRRASSRTAAAAAGACKSDDRCTCLILANFATPPYAVATIAATRRPKTTPARLPKLQYIPLSPKATNHKHPQNYQRPVTHTHTHTHTHL